MRVHRHPIGRYIGLQRSGLEGFALPQIDRVDDLLAIAGMRDAGAETLGTKHFGLDRVGMVDRQAPNVSVLVAARGGHEVVVAGISRSR